MTTKLQRILVPVAFSENCGEAVRLAATLAEPAGAEVRLFHVVESPPYELYLRRGLIREVPVYDADRSTLPASDQDVLVRDLLSEARTELERLAGTLGGTKHSVQVATGHPLEEILHAVEGYEADLVVMPTHQRQGIRRAFLGSVTEQVVRLSPVPVVAMPLRAE